VISTDESFRQLHQEIETSCHSVDDSHESSRHERVVEQNKDQKETHILDHMSLIKQVKDLQEEAIIWGSHKLALEAKSNQLENQNLVLKRQVNELLHQLHVQDEIRKQLHNRVLQLTGNIIVYVRVKKRISTSESRMTDKSPFSFPMCQDQDILTNTIRSEEIEKQVLMFTEPMNKDRGGRTTRQKRYKFCFDRVFSPEDTQDSVWVAVKPLVQSAIDGFNVCLFAYGQTGMYCYILSSLNRMLG